MTTLNPEQKDLLQKIVNDKFSVGAFSGMIFNAINNDTNASDLPKHDESLIDETIQLALNVRLRLEKLAQ